MRLNDRGGMGPIGRSPGCFRAVCAALFLLAAGTLWAVSAEEYRKLGDDLFAKQDYEKAAAYYEAAIKLAPNDARTWRMLGDCRSQLGQESVALETYKKALSLDPDDVPLQKYLEPKPVKKAGHLKMHTFGGLLGAVVSDMTPEKGRQDYSNGFGLFYTCRFAPAVGAQASWYNLGRGGEYAEGIERMFLKYRSNDFALQMNCYIFGDNWSCLSLGLSHASATGAGVARYVDGKWVYEGRPARGFRKALLEVCAGLEIDFGAHVFLNGTGFYGLSPQVRNADPAANAKTLSVLIAGGTRW